MVGGGALSGWVGASGRRHRLRKGSKNSGATQAGSGVSDGAAVIVCWNCCGRLVAVALAGMEDSVNVGVATGDVRVGSEVAVAVDVGTAVRVGGSVCVILAVTVGVAVAVERKKKNALAETEPTNANRQQATISAVIITLQRRAGEAGATASTVGCLGGRGRVAAAEPESVSGMAA